MRIVVFGGTRFLGRGVVDAAREHELTLVNRGNTGLYRDIEQIHLDLSGDLSALEGRTWDAAIDTDPTQLPRHTRRRAEALADAVDHYVFVSTISVYSDTSQPLDEGSPLHDPPVVEPEEFDPELYGGLKVGSERAVQDVFGDRAAIARAGLIVGPHDPTDRFTYWPRRLADGGNVLAPGSPSQPIQLVDARDLGAFLVRLAADRTGGVLNATGPAEPLTLGEALERMAGEASLVWTDEKTILGAGVRPWTELPLWLPGDEHAGLCRVDITRALAAGIAFRPLEETARDTLAWSRDAGEQQPTLSRGKEREILAGVAEHPHEHHHHHDHDHGHSHGLVHRSIVRSRAGVKAVSLSLAVLALGAGAQVAIFLLTGSVALLADLIHNFGDALTAVPLGIAFFLRSFRGEKIAGLFVVGAIFVSACVALYETIERFVQPQQLSHLWVLAAAGVVGFVANELAAEVRLRAGRRLSSPALIADGNHARIDGFVSLGVIASAALVALGLRIGDPVVGLAITLTILKITWDSWRVVSTTEPGEMLSNAS